MAAALALGANGVLCGTAFFSSDESLASENAKHVAVCGSGDDAERSSVFDLARGLDWPSDWNLRAMRNAFTRQWGEDIGGLEQNLSVEQTRFEAAQVADDTDVTAVIVGEACDLILRRESAQATLLRMISQAEDRIRHTGLLVKPVAVD